MVPVSFFLLSQPRPPVQLLQSLSLSATNSRWSERMKAEDPAYFDRLKNQQAPKYLWIGCADSRVPVRKGWWLPFFLFLFDSFRAGSRISSLEVFSALPKGFSSLSSLFLTPLLPSASLSVSLETRKNATGQPNPRPPPRGGLCPGKREKRRKRRERKEGEKKREKRGEKEGETSRGQGRVFFPLT